MGTRPILVIASTLVLDACNEAPEHVVDALKGAEERVKERPLLVSLPAERTGIRFSNPIVEDTAVNYFKYEYLYNGGGVAVGDLNNDGLQDVYFTGTLNPDHLYLNKGGLRFEDITATALPGEHQGWHSGVTMADVNNDGWLDIYVCRGGWYKDALLRRNLLYINQGGISPGGTPKFSERAEEFGIADDGRSTQAAFLDHDADGDLDLYVMNTPRQDRPGYTDEDLARMLLSDQAPSDHLYRNDGGRFRDVSRSAGIHNAAYGLGLVVSDLNDDGRPDIYVANDYTAPDFMYLNNGNGTFTERVKETTRHISNFGMGCDAADFNNDGSADIITLDMVSEDHVRSKKNMASMNADKFWRVVMTGNHYQYMFNTLQLNNGNGTFSEVAQQAGVSKTDWSWTPLLCDLDNDGWKDLIVTNGYKRDMYDRDFAQAGKELQSRPGTTVNDLLALVPTSRIRNYFYRNMGADSSGAHGLSFSDVSTAWGFQQPMNSNGAAYADLDNDGDLDVLINNIDALAELYENQAVQQGKGHWLRVKLEGDGGPAYGAKVNLIGPTGTQVQELQPTRGYQGAVERILHFGLGNSTAAKELVVRWPDGKETRFTDVRADQVVKVDRSTARPAERSPAVAPLLQSGLPNGLAFTHRENGYADFAYERLLPHTQSELGPKIGVGDANGDGLDDVFVGGARNQRGALFLQLTNGTFSESPSRPWAAHAGCEDMGSIFFDADNDGDRDLLVASGSNEVDQPRANFAQRLYLNTGNGNFQYAPNALPDLLTSAMPVCAADVDGDGDQDLFIGGRNVPGRYPSAPQSYLLINDGKGAFADATERLAPQLARIGLVSDAAFDDHDGDGDPDLIILGEWMPISFFRNEGGRFIPTTGQSGLKDTEGWWSSLTVADLDNDRDNDLVCGNIGWNTKFHATPEHPLDIFLNDFDGNGHGDIVLAKDYHGKAVPVRGRECSSEQCPMILEKFRTYDAFANASLEEIYGQDNLANALHLEAKHMRSCIVLNLGNGKWQLRDLPAMAQSAPINGSVVLDVNSDGHADIVAVGNHWGAEVETIRYDGGTGCVLLGDGKGQFKPAPVRERGLFAWENAKDLALVRLGAAKSPLLLVANNNGPLQGWRTKEKR